MLIFSGTINIIVRELIPNLFLHGTETYIIIDFRINVINPTTLIKNIGEFVPKLVSILS